MHMILKVEVKESNFLGAYINEGFFYGHGEHQSYFNIDNSQEIERPFKNCVHIGLSVSSIC